MGDPATTPAGIDGSILPGPYGVGLYAAKLRQYLRERSRVQLFGEVWNLRISRAKVYFELRDADGALPCSMWRTDFDALRLGQGALADGSQVVVGGGLDYYVGSRTSSPAFSFAVAKLRVAGEGDLLAQLDRLRKTLDAEGLFQPQKLLVRRSLPRTIGDVTGEGGKARVDVLSGLRRRGWAGRVVWAFAPVQDRHAAPRITAALQDLAATAEVDVIVVARGGGSLADLFCFCDETL
ncbi:MAG: exodeoxyribonuclease large subunit, partial [Solirubrobacteraceae bacterium]|nr:exodeoxyribonuclease large subunit [Solirubrobacteraceae bacterium]